MPAESRGSVPPGVVPEVVPPPWPQDPLLRFRSEFPILDETCYLVSHSLGPMPRAATKGLERYAEEWSGRGVRAWRDGWWRLPLDLGDALAPLLGAEQGTVCMQPNVTLASALLLSALTRRKDHPCLRIVTTDLDFPSMLYLYDALAGTEVEVHRVPSDDGITIDPARLLAAIDERTTVVALSHVLFRSSFLHDLSPIVARSRAMGAHLLLDVYQSAGVVPFSLRDLGVDFAVGGNLKWLLGGPGVAFLYVRSDLQETLAPRLTGWMAHQDPFGFEPPPIRRADGISRFLHGTPAIPALRAAEAGLAIVADAGVGAIRAKSLTLTRRLLDRAQLEGWMVRTPADDARRGGVVSLDPPHAYAVSQCLLDRNIIVDYRPGAGIRIAPHFYNTGEEVDRALDAIAEILATDAWRTHDARPRAHVT